MRVHCDMAPAMIGLLFLLAASGQPPMSPVGHGVPDFTPTNRVTAQATVSIRILSAASFGQGVAAGTEGAQRRKARLEDSAGNHRHAELLEFQ